jgi:hypothetical protein
MEAQHEDAPPANNRAVKLPPFWTTNPQAWFTSAEGVFRLRNIAVEESRFFNCLHALPEATVSGAAEPLHGAAAPPLGCPPADRDPEGGAVAPMHNLYQSLPLKKIKGIFKQVSK